MTTAMDSVQRRAWAGLRCALARQRPDVAIGGSGYVTRYEDNLLSLVEARDFEDDLRRGDGNELESKFCAAHSSAALAVNCFVPFRRRIGDLVLPLSGGFQTLEFERKCPTGLRGGQPPNLDVLLTGDAGIVGIESKLTEHLGKRPPAYFSDAYVEQIRDERCEEGYFSEMLRLRKEPDAYVWLDAAQLIKHAFGLAYTFGREAQVTLFYVYWEPENHREFPQFAAHRNEIEDFRGRVANSYPAFMAMNYLELWRFWRQRTPAQSWLSRHLDELEARYGIAIE